MMYLFVIGTHVNFEKLYHQKAKNSSPKCQSLELPERTFLYSLEIQ